MTHHSIGGNKHHAYQTDMNYSTIEKYINTFDKIDEGSRSDTLQKKGILLRTKFGLTGDALVSALSEVNQTKCIPPLPDIDVVRIAGSVDRADAPIGESASTEDYKERKASKKPSKQVEYCMSAFANSVNTADLLTKQVSAYSLCVFNTPTNTITIGEALETFRTGGTRSKALIEAIRNEPDEGKRRQMKQKTLPGIVFGSEPQTKRNNASCKHNGIVCLDFDNIPADELETAKQAVAKESYVFAVGISASKNGIFALAHYEGTPDLKILLAVMQADFHYKIDMSRSDLCGLRFVTLDPDLIIKSNVQPARLEKRTAAQSASPPTPKKRWTDFCDIQDEEDSWVVPEVIPTGELCLISGRQGSGKTFLTTWLAAHITNGSFFRGEQSAKGAVLFFPPEGKTHKVMRRLRKAGADLSLCSVIDSKFDNDGRIVPLDMKKHNELEAIINDYEAIKKKGKSASGHHRPCWSLSWRRKGERLRGSVRPVSPISNDGDGTQHRFHFGTPPSEGFRRIRGRFHNG